MLSTRSNPSSEPASLRVGIDLVRVSHIAESVEKFGERFLSRIFTPREIAYATSSPACRNERLAVRFAAKEAAMKALQLADEGVPWTDLEVARQPSGDCSLHLHGAAQQAVERSGSYELALSLSHEGDLATAIVIAQRATARRSAR
jgi:holo-[acyl-carrier protein] synthase